MPELPEVETVRRTLAAEVVGRTFRGVTVRRRDVIATELDPAGGFSRVRGGAELVTPRPARVPKAALLVGDRVVDVLRRGKQLAMVGASGRAVAVHLGMSGQLLVAGAGERLKEASWGDAHDHVVWRLDDGGRLVFRDPRRFGGLKTSPSVEHLRNERWSALGPDALEATCEGLQERAGASARAVKAVLLDQTVLAGVGNIYADEALFRARVNPARLARELDREAWARLALHVRGVLVEAIRAGGSTLRDYTDARGHAGTFKASHAVYGRGGEPCLACGAVLESALLAQRTTVWCHACQPLR